MPRVNLIFPAPGESLPSSTIQAFRNAVEAAGHDVEILVVASRGSAASRTLDPSWRTLEPDARGLATAVIAGLEEADGSFVAIIDLRRGYEPDDLLRVLEPLVDGRADVSIGNRHLAGAGRRSARQAVGAQFGRAIRPLLGTSDPLTGLIGINRSALAESLGTFRPIGDHFSLEVLSKLGGRWADVAIPSGPSRRYELASFDDLRHMKRLADHRFGNLSRLFQFCVVGASGMVVDLSFYAIFQALLRRTALAEFRAPGIGVHIDLAIAGLLSILIALTWNFFLNRRLTFNDSRGGPILRQYLTYGLSNALGITLSLSLRLLLPKYVGFFNDHRIAAALVGIVTATGVSFLMARWLVFSPTEAAPSRRPGSAVEGSPAVPESVVGR